MNISWGVAQWERRKKITKRLTYLINQGTILEHNSVTETGVASVECVLSYSKEVEVFVGQLGMVIG